MNLRRIHIPFHSMLFRIFHRQSGPESITEPRELLEEAPARFKEYERFPSTYLPHPELPIDSLKNLLRSRVSERDFDPAKFISLEDVSQVLFTGAGINKGRRSISTAEPRHHPSGGALYPLECYLATYRVSEIKRGVYHYAPKKHALEHIVVAPDPSLILEACKRLVPSENPAAVIILTSVWGRNYPKYGELAYRLTLLEAGHVMQNMLLAATSRGLKSFPLVGFRQEMVSTALDISDDTEDPLYAAFLGQ